MERGPGTLTPRAVGIAAAVLALCVRAQPVAAGCNIIPGTSTVFRAALGETDRPFARPGDFVTLSLAPACDAGSPGFGPTGGDHVVTVVFTPPTGAADRNTVVILTTDCAALESRRQSCAARPDIGSATCMQVADALPGPIGMEVFQRGGQPHLRFRFPDTDALLDGLNDDRTLAGPATIAVTAAVDPLPCQLASSPCTAQNGLLACVDTFFAVDGTCDTAVAEPTFPHFTALPPPNDYQAVCFEPNPPCTGTAPEVRFTTDTAGNVLLPMDWRGVLVGQGVPVARLLRGSSSLEAFPGGGQPVRIPGNGFLRSYSPEGGLLPPVFDPQSDPSSTSEATLFGSVDAPDTVLRIARRSNGFQQCAGGANDGLPCLAPSDCPGGSCAAARCAGGSNAGLDCTADGDCPGGECGPALFDFSTRYEADVGPVVVSRLGPGVCQRGTRAGQPCTSDGECDGDVCVGYRVVARDPVPLEGLNRTQQLFAFVVAESADGRDLNGDGDTTDDVVLLADRATGSAQPIGVSTAMGRAAARIRELPFSFPAVAVEGDVVAFLEPEAAQGDCTTVGGCDENGDLDASDTLLRAFRLGGGELGASPLRAADAAALLNGRSLVISAGRVFFRTSERAMARRAVERVSVDSAGARAYSTTFANAISPDARYVAMTSWSTSMVPGDTNERADIFVHDRQTGETERASVASNGDQADADCEAGSMSADGRFIAFQSQATTLVPDDTNGVQDIFVRDRLLGTTERASIATDGTPADGLSDGPSISADGRFVVFRSAASTLVGDDTNGFWDIFLRDRLLGTTERITIGLGGAEPNDHSGNAAISADGRYVAFQSDARNLVPGDNYREAYVYDRQTGTTERVSLLPGSAVSTFGVQLPSISADGRYVGFRTMDPRLVAGDTNGTTDVFVFDRRTRRTERVSVATSGEQGDWVSDNAIISADGRYVAFTSEASNLVPGDTNGVPDVFLRDRLTGITERVSIAADGAESDDYARSVRMSVDGDTVLFSDAGTNILPPFSPFFAEDAYVRGPDRTDPAGVDALLFADGALDDTVLEALDAATSTITTLCPAEQTAVVDGRAAFLRPESAAGTAACPGGSLNPPDADVDDRVVQLWPGSGAVQNLGCAATALALSATHVAALVSEAGQGEDLNGDGDLLDDVAMVRPIGLASSACADWTSTGQAADSLDISGAMVAFLTPESAQGAGGGSDLNGDGDRSDRIMQLWDADSATLIPGTHAAEEFVIGGTLLGYRTSEAADGGDDLNGDGDSDDDVLQVYDLNLRQRWNTHQAVTPCRLEACDPRIPYRVLNDTVKFLTFEAEQSEDLNQNGSAQDLVLQTFNLRLAQQQGAPQPLVRKMSAPMRYARTARLATAVTASAYTTLGAVSAGLCTTTGESCASDANCAGGSCFVPPGGCIHDLGTFCLPTIPGACPEPQFCQPTGDGSGTCKQVVDNVYGVPNCRGAADCSAPDVCIDTQASPQRLVDALSDQGAGSVVFTSSGRCVEPVVPTVACSADTDCAAGERCGGAECERSQGLCKVDDDCPSGARCEHALLVATDRDSDGDEIPDRFDNCVEVPNIAQEDGNDNGIGDACDRGPTPTTTSTPPATATTSASATPTATPTASASATPSSTPLCGAPLSGCRSAGKSLLIVGVAGGSDDKLVWKWLKGDATTPADLADPLHGARYTLCVYDGVAALPVAAAPVNGGAGWKPTARGFTYREPSGSQNGITKVVLASGGNGAAKILVKGHGVNLPDLLPLDAPVTLQLRNSDSGVCWGATFQSSQVKKSDATHFKAKAVP